MAVDAQRHEEPLASAFATPLAARHVLEALGSRHPLAQLGPALPARFTGISADSRALEPGYLFVALRGTQRDGHEFLEHARLAGAAAALVAERWVRKPATGASGEQTDHALPLLVVADPLTAMGDLAAWYRRQYSVRLVAITGSNGKTTAKEMIGRVLAQRYEVLTTAGNFNNLIGVPLMLFRVHDRHQAAVLELAMNRAGEIARLAEIVQPDVAVLTNVGPAHLGYFASLAAIAEAKAELLNGLNDSALAVLNADDPFVLAMADRLDSRVVRISVGKGDVQATAIEDRGLDGVRFRLLLEAGDAARRSQAVHLRCLGRHNVHHALAAAAVGCEFGLTATAIVAGLESFPGLPLRLEPMRLRNGAMLINDTYNANPASLAAAVDFLGALPRRGRALLVAGDMLELGEHAEELHRQAGRRCAEAGLDGVIGIGSFAAALIDGAQRGGIPRRACQVANCAEDAAAWLASSLQPDDVLLCKASRKMRLERLCERLAVSVRMAPESPPGSPSSSEREEAEGGEPGIGGMRKMGGAA